MAAARQARVHTQQPPAVDCKETGPRVRILPYTMYNSSRILIHMKQITLTLPDGSTQTAQAPVLPAQVLAGMNVPPKRVLGVRVNNDIVPLTEPLSFSCTFEPVMAGSREATAIYRRSLCFVLAAASRTLFPNERLLVGHSLGYSYYYSFASGTKLTAADTARLSERMQELISADMPIETELYSYEETARILEQMQLVQTRRQLNFLGKPVFKLNKLAGFYDLYFDPLVPSTGYLTHFAVVPYKEGLRLCYPATARPNELPPFEDSPKLFSVYAYYKQWGRKLGITSAAELNELIYRREINDFIDITETLQDKQFADIAEAIRRRGNVRVVLMAGPSSSGKTTSSKKLALQLKALGYRPKLIELDSYYVDRHLTPRDENGAYDYECLEALDVAQLNDDLVALFGGKEVQLPSYDFIEGKRTYDGKYIRLDRDDILVMEGIHGLNDKLTPLVPAEYKFKVYLSALTQLNLDDLNRISTRDNRLIRRIVRDSRFRGKSAADTIAMWDSVGKGERLHIFPFQNNADAMLNTALDYELAVLKVYAEPLLRCVTPLHREYAEASRLLRFLQHFSSISAAAVPPHSIIREFIGDSAFKY